MFNIEIPKESLCNLRLPRASIWAFSESLYLPTAVLV